MIDVIVDYITAKNNTAMKKILLAALICSQYIYLSAQSLSIGDTVPDVQLNHIYSYPGGKAHLKDFNKSCLILEFWNRYCGTCIDAFPFMERMEKRYVGKLQVLMVNPEPEELVDTFFNARKAAGLWGSSAPTCCNDTVLSQMFLHEYFPHFVWLDPRGRVYAITGGSEVTEQNIDAFIKGAPSLMAQKTDYDTEYDDRKPFLINRNGGNAERFLDHSILSGYIPGILRVSGIGGEKKGTSIVMMDQDIEKMYRFAFDRGDYDGGRGKFSIPRSLTALELTDTTPYCYAVNKLDNTENTFCYELRVSKPMEFQALKSLMKEDLNRYFHLRAHMEKRKIPCWVLESDDTTLVASKGGQEKKGIDRFAIDIQNVEFSELFILLQNYYMQHNPLPILDETGIRGNVDMRFNADLSSPESLGKALVPYKMHFTIKERCVDMLVLQDPLPEVE
jgi:thiol-disulfide isomerase/thioredoxin